MFVWSEIVQGESSVVRGEMKSVFGLNHNL